MRFFSIKTSFWSKLIRAAAEKEKKSTHSCCCTQSRWWWWWRHWKLLAKMNRQHDKGFFECVTSNWWDQISSRRYLRFFSQNFVENYSNNRTDFWFKPTKIDQDTIVKGFLGYRVRWIKPIEVRARKNLVSSHFQLKNWFL